ncbi:homoserine dehydrogenase [Halpernia frigidisoli]|uniref:Homoserine dehydrogenase n=1 Tax=Halpernia frigidisoli TaxID=1125876 RepID=A0A1I3FWW4_9FLAO|nr:homoserine dehydrogenase [Halpernia frigidisoli]SFI15730.1 homoserine dehydrogenase [Halpernia frigidisoli]
MSKKKLIIGLFGYGVVGSGLYEVLHQAKNLDASIKKIVVKHPEKIRNISAEHFTYDKFDILNVDEINTVVELIDDSEAAFEIVKIAMEKGKSVVSANKKMIAEHFQEIYDLQKKHNVSFLYEASVCGSIPIIRNLEEYYNNDFLQSIEGIVNGSTNYILTKIFEENMSFPDALKEAQEKGYAESNPILDTGGFDARSKLQILLAHSFGIITEPKDVFNVGIQNLSSLELAYAKEKNLQIKLLVYAHKKNEKEIITLVIPKFISANSSFSNVNDVFNGVKVQTAFADKQFFSGRGAGSFPTASAVLSDISALGYDYRYEYKKIQQNEDFCLTEDFHLKVLFRHSVEKSDYFKNDFEEIEEFYGNKEEAYFVGKVSFKNLKKISTENPDDISFVLIDLC